MIFFLQIFYPGLTVLQKFFSEKYFDICFFNSVLFDEAELCFTCQVVLIFRFLL